MGLPLFIPPVESDVPSKSLAKPAADLYRTRSPIRRAERRRQVVETREQRLRMLAASNRSSQHAFSSQRSATRSLPRLADAQHAPGSQSPGPEYIPDLAQRIIERRRHHARMATSAELPPADEFDSNQAIPLEFHPTPPELGPGAYDVPTLGSSAPSTRGNEIDGDNEMGRYIRRRHVERPSRPASVDPISGTSRYGPRARHVDGLGDRDRSLSPEGDGSWDILQSTVTLDPQVPSMGSSFASTTVSARASQASGTNSVHTSMTTPNEETEPPCDPVQNNSGSDGEDDVEQQLDELFQEPGPQAQQESQSSQPPESPDVSDPDREWLSGMHRIVRALASRTDIPDEWWAQAGLSRSMSWDDPN